MESIPTDLMITLSLRALHLSQALEGFPRKTMLKMFTLLELNPQMPEYGECSYDFRERETYGSVIT